MKQAPEHLVDLIEPIVEGLGYECVGIEYNPHPKNGLLRIYIDAEKGVLLEDCSKVSHQSGWKKSIYETYEDAEVPLNWTQELYDTCQKANIDFFTSPYDINEMDEINNFIPAFKVGSGDITFHDIVIKMANYHKPMLIATGASKSATRKIQSCAVVIPQSSDTMYLII